MSYTAPRSADEILEGIKETTRELNPAVDIMKGPIALLIYSYIRDLERAEEFSGYLQDVYQLENAELLEDADVIALGNNYGKDPNRGRAAQHLVHFYRYTRPEVNKTYDVPAGTACSSGDGRFIFNSDTSRTMDGNYADIYYSPDDSWYEIPVLVEAEAAGADYDLPPETITKVLTDLEDFDGCINKFDVRRSGADPADPIQFIIQLQNTLQGIGSDVAGHIIDVLQDIDPTGYDDISIVPSTNYELFKRYAILQSKLGYDIYVISDVVIDYQQEGIAQGGELSIPLDHKPVLSVTSVSVNGTPVAFDFNPDTNVETRGSPLADDKVILVTPLLPLQAYQITYQYYDFVYQGWQAFQGRQGPFGADVLVRLANPIDIYIAGEADISASVDKEEVISDMRTFTELYLRDQNNPSQTRFSTLLEPTHYVDSIKAAVAGLNSLKLTGFIRTDNASLAVESIPFDGSTEYPVLAANYDIT